MGVPGWEWKGKGWFPWSVSCGFGWFILSLLIGFIARASFNGLAAVHAHGGWWLRAHGKALPCALQNLSHCCSDLWQVRRKWQCQGECLGNSYKMVRGVKSITFLRTIWRWLLLSGSHIIQTHSHVAQFPNDILPFKLWFWNVTPIWFDCPCSRKLWLKI